MGERRVHVIGVAGPGHPVLLDRPEPEPQDGQVWLQTLWSGISAGTEIALVRGTDPHHRLSWDRELRAFLPGAPSAGYPIGGLGYMEVARVAESAQESLPVGTLVGAAYGHQSGRCATPGQDVLVPLPEGLDPVLGVYAAQMGPICVNGLLHAAADVGGPGAGLGDGVRGRCVLVVGAGVVGLLTALLARRHGAADVVLADSTPRRRRVAEALGLETLDHGVDEAWRVCKQRWRHGPGDRGADVAFQCRGFDVALATALKSLRPQGSVIDLAFYQGGAGAVHLGQEFHHNGLTIRCAQIGRVPRGMTERWDRARLCEETLELLGSVGPALRRHLVTDMLPFDEGPAFLADLATRRRSTIQAVLSFDARAGDGSHLAEAATG